MLWWYKWLFKTLYILLP